MVAELDPATAARIDTANPARVQRAWEVLRATGRGRSDRYAGGTVVWIRDHGQSWEKKTAHAMKMAEVLADAGICASYGERLD